ncbi:hypothetical protein DVH24_010187 [Malus domestica]|uniref:EF-hand domain-containing protein n=1 Tax=Malus domestica TaxID=3750 RepID=A0A498JWJ2_MALDO|nr:hypothetical protein DVH24_010187 [Malus domestica]
MASTQNQSAHVDLFDAYFRRADLDRDGRISGNEAVAFFQGSGLPKQVLAQIDEGSSVTAVPIKLKDFKCSIGFKISVNLENLEQLLRSRLSRYFNLQIDEGSSVTAV